MNKLRLQYKGAHNYTLTHLKYSPADTYNKTQHFANDDIENIKESDRYILFSPLGASAASKRNAARVAGNARRLLLQRGRRATANSRPSPSEKLVNLRTRNARETMAGCGAAGRQRRLPLGAGVKSDYSTVRYCLLDLRNYVTHIKWRRAGHALCKSCAGCWNSYPIQIEFHSRVHQ